MLSPPVFILVRGQGLSVNLTQFHGHEWDKFVSLDKAPAELGRRGATAKPNEGKAEEGQLG